MRRVTLPNKLVLETLLEQLQQGRKVTIPMKGRSMQPFLRPGDRVTLRPFELRELRRGMIILARQDTQMLLHRVLRFDERQCWLAGDNNLVQQEAVAVADVLAIAVKINRAGQIWYLDEPWRYQLGLAWYKARPLRRVLKKLFD